MIAATGDAPQLRVALVKEGRDGGLWRRTRSPVGRPKSARPGTPSPAQDRHDVRRRMTEPRAEPIGKYPPDRGGLTSRGLRGERGRREAPRRSWHRLPELIGVECHLCGARTVRGDRLPLTATVDRYRLVGETETAAE